MWNLDIKFPGKLSRNQYFITTSKSYQINTETYGNKYKMFSIKESNPTITPNKTKLKDSF